MTADSFHTYTWDADGNTTAVDTTTLTYDRRPQFWDVSGSQF